MIIINPDANFNKGMLCRHQNYLFAVSLFFILIGCVSPLASVAAEKPDLTSHYKNIRFRHLSINEGLSQNFVSAIYQDHLGFIWIGTKDGLNMYDGFSFTIYAHNPFDEFSISDNTVTSIYSDSQNRLWVGTMNGGLNLYDRQHNRFIHFIHDPDDENTISSNNIQSIICDTTGNLWVGTLESGLNRLTLQNKQEIHSNENITITRFTDTINGISLANIFVRTFYNDSYGKLWIGSEKAILRTDPRDPKPEFSIIPFKVLPKDLVGQKKPEYFDAQSRAVFHDSNGNIWMAGIRGLFRYDSEQDLFVQFIFKDRELTLNKIFAAKSLQSRGKNEIWMGGETGVIILDCNTFDHAVLMHDKDDINSLQKSRIISLFTDIAGTIWIGTAGYGISVYDPYAQKFNYPDEIFTQPDGTYISTRDLSLKAIHETSGLKNYLWLGTYSGLFRINRQTSEASRIILDAELLPLVYSIDKDKYGVLWLGSNHGLISLNPDNNEYHIYPTELVGENRQHDRRVLKVLVHGNKIWIVTANTIALLHQKTKKFTHFWYNDEPVNETKETVFPYVHSDIRGNLWVGTRNGLHFLDIITNEISSYFNDPDDPNSLSFNDIRAIQPDPFEPDAFLWLATRGGGFGRFDINTRQFRAFTDRDGLPNNIVYGMLYDAAGNFWLSTNHGLSKFHILSETFTNFTVYDGLQSNEFNSGAFYRSERGEMFFGGIKGYNNFFPEEVALKPFNAPVVITSARLLTQTDPKNKSGISLNIAGTEKLSLKPNQNHITVEFAALDFAAPSRNQFAYTFTTKEEKWVNIGENRNIILTNLKPGTYTLKVRGTNNDGIWSSHEAKLSLSIAKPWWVQNVALLNYALFFLAIFAGFRRYELTRINLRNSMKIAHLEANQLKDLDQLKSRFFANISHEFRTPLTLIKGPIEQMIEETNDPVKQKKLWLMYTNTDKLLNLVNQLLDLSRLESGQYPVKTATGDIAGYVKGLLMSFEHLANQKNIELKYVLAQSFKDNNFHDNFYFDRDIIEKIVNNLVSNAIKFTGNNGRITIRLCLIKRDMGEYLEIAVKDTGIGIPSDKLPFIFDRFYQVDDSAARDHSGVGIGLAYVKELIRVHKGIISAKSKPNVGTTFRVVLPVGEHHYTSDQIIEYPVITSSEQPRLSIPQIDWEFDEPISDDPVQSGKKPLVLVVEDNDEVRTYICENLRNDFHLLQASDAFKALPIAEESIPDLIISDVMMPGMDGFEFCEKIKQDEKTSHIPVILLTSRAAAADKIHGLETGADDYLTKPFSTKELLVRVKNLIQSRRVLREKFKITTIIRPGEISVSSRDQVFMGKLLKIIEQNMGNEYFSVDDFSREAAMSTTQFHRKLKALINQTPLNFIKSARMHRAKELLEKDAGNIADIAYMVGYNDPGYFTKTYRSFFGSLPSDMRRLN